MNKQKLEKIEVAGFILKPNDPDIKSLYLKIKKSFEEKGIEVILAKRSANMIGEDGELFDTMCEKADFLVSLGGDGTLLSLERRSYGHHKTVVWIIAGT